ncbi:MAG TPA: hypothetical protein VHU81_18230 [Thermoanaerobaculia bacterium]|jgi:hypothetical protein|nr:hypothetical protein [Thermoanaerobaculia bacterium]
MAIQMTSRGFFWKGFLGLCLAAASTVAAQAQCPTATFVIDLKGAACAFGTLGALPAGAVTVQKCVNLAPNPAIAACPAAAQWKEALIQINIPAGCTQANVVVEYQGLPAGWTVNLGDSPTNDGFAGDAGSTPNNAELWILDERLAIANGSGNAAQIDNPVFQQDVSLTNSSLKFAVKNQYVGWGQPYAFLQTPATKNLFAIPDTAAGGDGRKLYLGLNQVITGRADRKGCGAKRAMVSFL